MNIDKPVILKAAELPAETVAELGDLFERIDLPADPGDAQQLLKEQGARVRGVALRKVKVDEAFLDALPALEIISSYSAGLDNVDLEAVKAHGIHIENTSHILAEDVANAAIALALGVTRDLAGADRFVRQGLWPKNKQYPLGRSLSKMKVGIVALGSIGSAIAHRLQAFGCEVVYFGPRPKPVELTYYADLVAMANDCDMLILACPLDGSTHHLINAEVLTALGEKGYLVNIARGPVVDEACLIEALANDRIAGAALDVFEHEPQVPQALIDDPRVLLTPHIGSATEETRQAMANNVVDSLANHFGLSAPQR